jgi:hypothetical protein
VRWILGTSIATLVAVGLVACTSDAVIIGIEGDGGPTSPLTTPVKSPSSPPLEEDASGINLGTTSDVGDAGFVDADLGPCFPDAGCPVGSTCQYSVEAGCGAPGECFAAGGPPFPPPSGFVRPGPRPLVNGYVPDPIVCDGGPADAHAD